MGLLENANWEKYCQKYCDIGVQVKSYMAIYTACTYDTAISQSTSLHKKPVVKDRIAEIRKERDDELSQETLQTKAGVVKRLLKASAEALAKGNYMSYAKMEDMIIKVNGLYSPDKLEHSGTFTYDLKFPSLDAPTPTKNIEYENIEEEDDEEDFTDEQ